MSRNCLAPDTTRGLALWDRVAEPSPPPSVTPGAAIAARDKAMNALAKHSGEDFIAAAADFMLAQLKAVGPQTSEQLVDACKAAGIRAHDDRAFGPPIARLSRRGLIVRVGEAMRSKGHGATGGNRWAAK